ncbi:hypothetical protein GUJ93_ZPchr0001g32179 [Zizania palustris]|nr:hypothetical protein GUJ93_ZPchr0001g32179 [Zizania palustris]
MEEEERKCKAAIEEAEKQYSEISSEIKDLDIKSKQFEELEESYLSISDDISPGRKRCSFGQDRSFPGCLSNVQVEWDEINAAWGQAALLLHTMAQYFSPKFQYRIKIHPMGSYPRVTDINNNTYELFGPVNLFWSTRYDKAMTWFLTCLQEFAEFAISLDRENNVPPEKSLKLPYKIDIRW